METFTSAFGIVCLISLLIAALGFIYFIYFFSIGYAFSIAGMALATMILFWGDMEIWGIAFCVLLAIYGLRLGIYLLVREIKSASYRKILRPETDANANKRSLGFKVTLWIMVVTLFIGQFAPVFFRIQNGSAPDTCAIVGFFIALAGVILEILADAQKSMLKRRNPNEFCRTGIYRMVRCPNYLGEILLWTGVFLSGFTALDSLWQWIISVWGYVLILWVMFSGARRLELRQNKNYGDRPEYKEYITNVPIILPFVPLYSVARYKWLMA